MAPVDDVKTAVGEHDRLAPVPSPGELFQQGLQGANLGAALAILLADLVDHLRAGYRGGAELFDFDSAGNVSQVDGCQVITIGRQADGQRGQHDVAGAGHIVDRAWFDRDQFAPLARREIGAVTVQRNHDGLDDQILPEMFSGPRGVGGRVDLETDGI